jgi:hypothetical protein
MARAYQAHLYNPKGWSSWSYDVKLNHIKEMMIYYCRHTPESAQISINFYTNNNPINLSASPQTLFGLVSGYPFEHDRRHGELSQLEAEINRTYPNSLQN